MKEEKVYRAFTASGPFGSGENFYTEIPEDWPVNYLDDFYDDFECWWGLTFGGWAVVRQCEIIGLYPFDAHWKENGEPVTKESIIENGELHQEGDEVISLIGGDDGHINLLPRPAWEESAMMAMQVNRKVKLGYFNEPEEEV